MQLPKFLYKILPKNSTGEKINKRDKELLDQYNKGNVLQVDNKIDNKEFFKKLLENGKISE